MTPEERASSLMTQLACKRGQEVGWEPHTGREDAWIESSIAAAIRAAVEAEREECAEQWSELTCKVIMHPTAVPLLAGLEIWRGDRRIGYIERKNLADLEQTYRDDFDREMSAAIRARTATGVPKSP